MCIFIVLHFCIALYCQLDSVIKLYYVSIFMLLRFCFWFSKILLLLIYLTEGRCAYNQRPLLVSTGFQCKHAVLMLMSSICRNRRSITTTAVLSGSFDVCPKSQKPPQRSDPIFGVTIFTINLFFVLIYFRTKLSIHLNVPLLTIVPS